MADRKLLRNLNNNDMTNCLDLVIRIWQRSYLDTKEKHQEIIQEYVQEEVNRAIADKDKEIAALKEEIERMRDWLKQF